MNGGIVGASKGDVMSHSVNEQRSGMLPCIALRLLTSEDGTHSGSRNVFGKFILHTVQKP
jgi:hypothetical protein